MRLLTVLASSAGQPMSREQLLDAVWPDVTVNEDALSRAISQLRRALSDDTRNPRYVRTVHKGGYCLTSEVRRGDLPSNASLASWWRPISLASGLIALVALGVAIVAVIGGGRESQGSEPAYASTPLTSEPGREIDPAISADGKRVAFGAQMGSGFDVFWRPASGGDAIRLTNDGRFAGFGAWSPGGDKVAFVRALGRGSAIFAASVQTGRLEKLVDLRSWCAGLDWSPDGRTLAYSDGEPGGARTLALFDIQTRAHREIARETTPDGLSRPVFSNDGARLAFLRDAGLGLKRIIVVHLDNLESARPLALPPQDIVGLDWLSRDLIYSARDGKSFRLWKVSPESGVAKRISSDTGDLVNPSAASDGRAIVAEAVERDSDIWVADLNGEGGKPLIRSTADDLDGTSSPDGSRIAFVSARSGSPELWVARGDGSEPRQMTRLGLANLGSPVWSNDGQRIAFFGERSGRAATYVLDLVGGLRRFETPAYGSPLGWGGSPDDLYVAVGSGSTWTIERRSLASAQRRVINPVPARAAALSSGGDQLYLLVDDGNAIATITLSNGRSDKTSLPDALRGATSLQAAGDHLYLFLIGSHGTSVYRRPIATGAGFEKVSTVPSYGRVTVSPGEQGLMFTNDRETANDIVLLTLAH